MPSLFERLLGDDTPDEQVDLESRQETADEALREAVERGGFDVEDCGVTAVAVVNEGPDGEPVVVPVARFSLGEAVEDPDRDRVWDLVGVAAAALAPAFADVFVRHHDVQFTFDGDELFEAEECRRVLLTDDLATRYADDTGYDVADLRRAVADADDIDDEVAPVAWGDVVDYATRNGAPVVVGGGAGAGGAAAAAAAAASANATAATCAGAAGGAAGAAGGGGVC